jgi:hypothetical protein
MYSYMHSYTAKDFGSRIEKFWITFALYPERF